MKCYLQLDENTYIFIHPTLTYMFICYIREYIAHTMRTRRMIKRKRREEKICVYKKKNEKRKKMGNKKIFLMSTSGQLNDDNYNLFFIYKYNTRTFPQFPFLRDKFSFIFLFIKKIFLFD